jgi:hypothetical protein
MPLVDNDEVASWTDKVSLLSVTQGTSSKRPLFKTNVINDIPVVRFDDTEDELGSSSILTGLSGLTGLTVFAVVVNTTSGGGSDDVITGRDTPANKSFNLIIDPSGVASFTIATSPTTRVRRDGSTDLSAFGSTHTIITARFEGSVEQSVFINGVNDDGAIDGSVPVSIASGGDSFRIGADGAGSFFGGDIAEVIIFLTNLSDVSRNNVEAELAAKYAIPEPSNPVGGMELWLKASDL